MRGIVRMRFKAGKNSGGGIVKTKIKGKESIEGVFVLINFTKGYVERQRG
jgi:hypothetical protein